MNIGKLCILWFNNKNLLFNFKITIKVSLETIIIKLRLLLSAHDAGHKFQLNAMSDLNYIFVSKCSIVFQVVNKILLLTLPC